MIVSTEYPVDLPARQVRTTGRTLVGKLKRFDRFAVVIESQGKEILVYKHAIAQIASAGSQSHP